MIKPEQIKAARALLRLEQEELARKAGVSVSTIRRLEASWGESLVAGGTAGEVQRALEEAGVEFIHEGVCLRQKAHENEKKLAALRAIAERSASQQAGLPPFTEADLYGDDGLPA
jgi:transcriptional regulator with XRE-family HTH domain